MKRSLVGLAVASVLVASFGGMVAAQADPPSGMSVVADWEMNERPGAAKASDSGPNGLDAAVGNVVRTGQVQGSSTFYTYPYGPPNKTPADTPRLVVADSADLNPGNRDFSISFTYRTTRDFGNIIQKGQHGAKGGYFKVEQPQGHLTCLFRGLLPNGQLNGVLVSSGILLDDGNWHSITCTRTANEVTMTIDGTITRRTTGQSGNISNTVPLTIGGKTNCDQVAVTCDFFTGDIDRVEIDAVKPPAPPSPPPGYVASAGAAASGTTAKVQVPASVRAGELLLLHTSYVNTAAVPADPAGWTRLGTANAAGLASTVWWKLATAADVGSSVAVNLSASAKSTSELLAYAGVDQSRPIDGFATATDQNTSTHRTPAVSADTPDWAVSLWTDKSSTASSWTLPASVVNRDTRIGAGVTHLSSVSADSGGPIAASTYGGLTANSAGTSSRGTMWTIAVNMD